ncbi:MAG TPA: hypothetical protein VLF43_03965 [Candidatus Saccharimonadales bacterium]|nr:hypothetical protein [Candidatus Saccharimonadales bacterium]
MSNKNKHGLSRDVPTAIKRKIRQMCGFGCVICGSAIHTYEHIDPTFNEATIHDPARMTLLCEQHQGLTTRGFLSKESIKKGTEHPKCLEKGFSFGPFDIGSDHPEVQVGSVTAKNVGVIIRAMGDDILKIEPPEEPGGPFRLSALLSNREGTEILRIEQNEWMAATSSWDVQTSGGRITIHNSPKDIGLVLKVDPPRSISVEKLDMYHKGVRLKADDQVGLQVIAPSGVKFTTTGAEIEGGKAALVVTESGIVLGLRSRGTIIKQAAINSVTSWRSWRSKYVIPTWLVPLPEELHEGR